MSFIAYDSSIVKQNASTNLFATTNAKSTGTSSIQVFNQSLPETETKKETKEPEINRNFDIDDLVKKYKKEPSQILDELGINFTDAQRKELESLIKDKKSLKSFLEIVKQDKLNAGDIYAGMKKSAEKKGSGFFGRIGNFFKTAVKEGISEAIDLAKSEKVYYAEKLGSNMNEIREERDDFSSEGVANIAQTVTDEPEIKNSTMHFVSKEGSAGVKLYTETDVTKAVDIMKENPKDAELFTANAAELEAIKDENGNIRYKGSTIINVDEKMIKNQELQNTMMNTAKKKDMKDDYLVGITDNLVYNPEMQDALDKFLALKDKNGNDRLSASNIYSQSDYMKDKDNSTITNYCNNTVDLCKYDKLSGDNIVSVAGNITDRPEIKNAVYNQINDQTKSGDQVQNFSNQTAPVSGESTKANGASISQSAVSKSTKETTNPLKESYIAKYQRIAKEKLAEDKKNVTNNEEENYTQKTVIAGKTYNRSTVQYALYRRFGTAAEKILQKMEKDPDFINLIKRYGNQTVIIEALADNPTLVSKLKGASASISVSELSEMIKLSTDAESTNLLIELTQKYGASKAIQMTRNAQINNIKDETSKILSKTTLDSSAQKEQIEELSGKGQKTNYVS